MATNFPDTSQLKDDGFPWADGDVFDDTANSGYIYYWYDPVWKTALSQSDSDDRYVNIGGDVMSGSLALTDKITLDATDGSAEFAGNIDVYTIGKTYSLQIDSLDDVYTYGFYTKDDTQGVAGRALSLNLPSTASEFQILNPDGDLTANFKADGSASFANTIKAGGTTTDPNIQLNADGAPFFRREATSNTIIFNANAIGAAAQPAYIACKPSKDPADGVAPVFTVDRNGAITSGGTAYFAGDITTGSFDTGSGTGQGSLIQAYGGCVAQRADGAGASDYLFQAKVGTDTVWRVNALGQSTFSNAILNLETDNPDNYTITTEEYQEQEEVTPYVPAVPATYDEYGNELTAEVPAVEATYQTVTKTREISTYTGPTLDVKDRLQNLISRMDAIESDEIADDATSTLLLTTVNNINTQMTKINVALEAIRTAANTAGTLDQLKSDIAAATADI